MAKSNPTGDFLIPFLSFLVVLALSILIFAKLAVMDLPGRSDLMTLVLPTSLGGGSGDDEGGGGLLGTVMGYLPLVLILCIYASLIISLIALSAVLSPYPLAGGLAVAFGIIIAIFVRSGVTDGTKTVALGILVACLYSAYASWKKFSALIQFSGGEVSSAGASGFMFIVALSFALVAYNVVTEDQGTMRDHLLGNLFTNIGYTGTFSCQSDDTDACIDGILREVTQQMAKGQIAEGLQSQLNCPAEGRLRSCIRGMIRGQLPEGTPEDQVEAQTDTNLEAILRNYGMDTGQDWSDRTLDELVDEIVRSSPNVAREVENSIEKLKPSLSMVTTMIQYLPYMTAFIVFTSTMFTQSLVRPITSVLASLMFSTLLSLGIITTVEKTITIERYVVAVGGEAPPPKKHGKRKHKPLPPPQERGPEKEDEAPPETPDPSVTNGPPKEETKGPSPLDEFNDL